MPTIDQSSILIPRGRMRALYTFRASLYAPAANAAVSIGDEESRDAAFELSPRFTNVPGYYQPTPEMAEIAAQGLNKENSILVSDRWWFLLDQEINDSWLIVMTGCLVPNHPYIGRCWITQGNSEVIGGLPGCPANSVWVYAKISPTQIIPSEN